MTQELDVLVEERVAQLERITKRRNELLTEMFCMIRRRDNIGGVLTINTETEGNEDLQAFLQKHDLNTNPDTGTITGLNEASLFAKLQDRSEDAAPEDTVDRDMDEENNHGRDESIVSSHSSLDSEDELDLIERPFKTRSSSARHRTNAQGSSSSRVAPAEGALKDKPSTQTSTSINDRRSISQAPNVAAQSTTVQSRPSEDIEMQDAHETESASYLITSHPEEEEEEEEESILVVDTRRPIQPPTLAPIDTVSGPALIAPPVSTIPVTAVDNPPATPISTVRPQDLHPESSNLLLPVSRSTASPIKPFKSPNTSAPHDSRRHHYSPHYTLPPIKALPVEFSRKSKPKARKKEKEGKREREKDKDRDEWTSLGLNRWGFTITANPVWKRVAKASKCLTTRDWSVAMTELRLARTIDRIDTLKDVGKWSFRQPKRQRNVDNISKTHWDYLMDEMKWMRIDFREERKWKIAVAYNLSTSVLEWHAAGSTEERIRQGICVLWRRPLEDVQRDVNDESEGADSMAVDEPRLIQEQQADKELPGEGGSSMLMLDYGSDEDEGDEQDRESVIDALETAVLIEESLDRAENTDQDPNPGRIGVETKKEPKTEEIDYSASLANENNDEMEGDISQNQPSGTPSSQDSPEPKGLKAGSTNPIMESQSTSPGERPSVVPMSKSSKINLYGPVRERVVFSDADKLFLEWDDFKIVNRELPDVSEVTLPIAELPDLFPDLQTLSLFDPPSTDPSPVETKETKKKGGKSDRDDGTRRLDEFNYSKVFPMGTFMTSKPTLISALQPAKRWRDGQWLPWDEAAILPVEVPSNKALEEASSDLFGRSISRDIVGMYGQTSPSKREFAWSPKDDELLRSLIEKYGTIDREKGTNWRLIAECFNASRVTVPSDRRGPGDCLLRWRERWGPVEGHAREQLPTNPLFGGPSLLSAPAPIVTRGVKRLASNSISSVSAPTLFTGAEAEPKTKRHKTVQDCMRKLTKRRAEVAQKNSVRKTNNTHETHVQYSKLPSKSPGELVRVKMERDLKEQNEARARQAQATAVVQAQQTQTQATQAQVAAAALAARKAASPPNNQHATSNGQSIPTQAPTPIHGQAQTSQPKPVVPTQPQALAASIPIRNQVNISQQRIATPLLATNRGTPQQILRQQQQHAQVAQQQQAQMNALSHQALTPQQIQNAIAHLTAQTQTGTQAAIAMQAGNAHASPPLTNAAAATANASRPGSAQPRATNVSGHYYLPNLNMGQYTQEQLYRYQAQALQQQQIQAAQQQQQHQATPQQQQAPQQATQQPPGQQ